MNNSSPEKLLSDYQTTLDTWISELKRYQPSQLYTVPSSGGWSLGQLYMHLLETGAYHLQEVKECLSTSAHEREEASANAKAMFSTNSFPSMDIEGPSSNNRTPQPESMDYLITGLKKLKAEMEGVIHGITSTDQLKGKTRHPGLHYFNALEWLQFSEMHFRHHFRQKQKLDSFLNQPQM